MDEPMMSVEAAGARVRENKKKKDRGLPAVLL
jgi:hypothetical protein